MPLLHALQNAKAGVLPLISRQTFNLHFTSQNCGAEDTALAAFLNYKWRSANLAGLMPVALLKLAGIQPGLYPHAGKQPWVVDIVEYLLQAQLCGVGVAGVK